MSSHILFNVRPHQTRMAFVKDGVLKDIFYHRDQDPSLMGAVYKGKVSRLAKRLNFAFVELGLKKSGFLYGKDIINRGNQPLNRILKPGTFTLVQVKSDPARGKGPRLTQELSFSGRYLVYMPTQAKKTAVSRRIPSTKEKERLSEILKNFNEPCALIARTLSEGRSEEELKKDLETLKLKWTHIQEAYEQAGDTKELQKGFDPGLTYLKDLMNDTIETVWVDNKQAFSRVKDFVTDLQPDLKSRVQFFSGKEGLFKKFDIESQIQKTGQKKVYLKNGGSIIIEELEAFSVIDVNSGRFMGKGEQQDAILSVNLSAARVIAQQIRLRHLGGIILIDFIDMESENHREKLVSFLDGEFSDDRNRPRVFPMAELGLVQITRKRERHPLSAFLSQNCSACGGRGYIKSYPAIAGEIFQALEEQAEKRFFLKKALSPQVMCHPEIKEWIKKERKSLEFLKKEFRITPELVSDPLLPTHSFTIKQKRVSPSEQLLKDFFPATLKVSAEQGTVFPGHAAIRTIDKLSEKIRSLGLEIDTDIIHNAYEYSKKAHEGQKRQSGEPYISHPLNVADILVNLQMDQESIVTALLHDVVEDTSVTIEEIKKEFGSNIAFLVDGVTKISRMNFQNLHHKQSENIRKMIVAMGKDVRVILVKLADRLHNLRTLKHLPEEKQVRIAEETLEVYAPLASRLGMNTIKTEMEDLSFKHFNPQAFSSLKKKMSDTEEERGKYMEEVIHQLDENLKKFMKIKYEIQGRYKNFYSIYRKMTLQNLTFEQISDILGFRVCVNKPHECYEILGLVHSFWKPVPGRFKDFIALPKINDYQSLHTTVIGPQGRQIEVQIRTFDMHFMAENGIAAHWIYKLGRAGKQHNVKKTLEQVNWLKSMVSWNQQVSDSGEFLENVKLDLFESEIYALTPTGEIKEFPKGATPIDFAFAIHTDVGSTMRAARVNSRQVPLKYKLQSGDVVEIITSKKQKPSKDWLKFCVTSRARSKIKQFIKTEERKKALEIGEKLMEKGYQTFAASEKELLSHPLYEKFMKENGLNRKEDLLISLGFGKILFKNMFHFIMKPEKTEKDLGKRESAPSGTSSKSLITVEGADHIMVHFAKCCHPVSGDSIKGYISRKKGIVIHRAECFILGAVSSERFVDVAWKKQTVPESNYTATLQVLCMDEPGTLNRLSEAFTFFGLNISDIRIHRRQDLKAFITFSTKVKNVGQMNALITRLRKINDVIHVSRELMDPRN